MRNATRVRTNSLNFWTCYFLDSEDGVYPTRDPNVIFKCRNQGRFLSVDPASEDQYIGHAMCTFIWVLIVGIGLFGFVTNVLNVLVLRRSLKGSSLQSLLVILAVSELLACVLSIVFATVVIVVLENWDRGLETFVLLKVGHVLYSLGRTISIYITILVTIERYLVVAFPIQSKSWLTPIKSRIYLVVVTLFATALDLPWIFNSTVIANDTTNLIPGSSLAEFPYIFKRTSFARDVYSKVRRPLLYMNYVAPFPLLLIFNVLLYLSIYRWKKSRQALSTSQKKEMSTAKMFSVVVLVLLLCHSVSAIIVLLVQTQNVIYRELMLLQVLSVTVSAAVNFLVYYKFGRSFREEFAKLRVTIWVSTAFSSSKNKYHVPAEATTTSPTQTSRDGGESTTSENESCTTLEKK